MKTTRTMLMAALAVGVWALAGGLGCGGEDEAAPEPSASEGEGTRAAEEEPGTAGSDEASGADEAAPGGDPSVVDAYDAVRAALAGDDLAATRASAKRLAEVASEDEALAAAATGVASEDDIEDARDAFGELSKRYLTWLEAHPAQKEGLHAFRCPMARGYKKWVQKTDEMANPYMGQRMLACGGPTELTP